LKEKSILKNDQLEVLRLGELLLADKLINEQELQRALDYQAKIGDKLGAILVRLGAISEENLLLILSKQLLIPIINNNEIPIESQNFLEIVEFSDIERDWWLDQDVLAWEVSENLIYCIARDPLNDTINEVFNQIFTEKELVWHLVRTQDLERALDLLSKSDQQDEYFASDDVQHLRELAEGAPVVEFVSNLLSQAVDQRASDVHIEPEETVFFARYRIDGILREYTQLPYERFAAISSRIKLISGLDIAERRLPQDGRLNIRVSGQELDIRVSTLPGVHGESIVMRLLPKERQASRLSNLGFLPDHYKMFTKWVSEPHGIILVTGPTGSGKSTTLYATLDELNDRSQKIITVEDPVEYQLKGVTQVQAHSDIGYTFAKALRSILRQDPDIIMIGEIRDLETSEIAIQSALTGHMVLSTLHTNDAVSAFTRLIDMGIEPFLVATSVRAVQAQRLVRRLCPNCTKSYEPLKEIQIEVKNLLPKELINDAHNWKQAIGCEKCQHTGYIGRVGIYEMVYLNKEMQSLILERVSVNELRSLAIKQGFRTLRDDGLIKAYQGVTTIEEVMRVTSNVSD
jgi:general secretion pathway protein E